MRIDVAIGKKQAAGWHAPCLDGAGGEDGRGNRHDITVARVNEARGGPHADGVQDFNPEAS